MRLGIGLFLLLLFLGSGLSAVRGQDLPLVRKLLQQQLMAEMLKHDSEETAWYNEKSVDRQKWSSGKVLGKKIRLASWTEQSKTWLWLEDPEQTLHLELTKLAVVDGRAEFALTGTAKARFKAWGRIPKLAKGSVGGNLIASFTIEGSTAMRNGGFDGTQVTRFEARLHDLRFNNDLVHPLEDLIKDGLNDYVEDKNGKFRRTVEQAIDRVKF
jgi:hypothetical protein